jgi:sugar lactone lactonase YvrE
MGRQFGVVVVIALCAGILPAPWDSPHQLPTRQVQGIGKGPAPLATERPPHPPRFVRAWGKNGTAPGEFIAPIGIAIDRHDRIFVADFGNQRVQQFDTDGKFLTAFVVDGGPGGIAVGRDGTVYVSLTMGKDRIVAFTPEGKLLRQWGKKGQGDGELDHPTGLAVGPDGSVYVADNSNRRIQKFSPQGKFLAKWGQGGGGPGQFGGKGAEKQAPAFGTGPGWLAFDGKGLLYASDAHGGKVHRFKPNGDFVSSWGSNGGPGGFGAGPKDRAPMGIAIDRQGRVWVAANNRLQLFTAEGRYLTGFGAEGVGEGELRLPHGLAIDSRGHLYVADTRNHRIQKFAP